MLTKGREKRKLGKNVRIGFTICPPPMREGDIKNQNLPKIKQIEMRKNKMRLDIKPELDESLERKMYISSIEKPLDCGFILDKYAVSFFNKHYRDGPFMIIPSLEGAERAEVDFNLSIYSDQEVELKKVDDHKCQILTGDFDSGSAGGS